MEKRRKIQGTKPDDWPDDDDDDDDEDDDDDYYTRKPKEAK